MNKILKKESSRWCSRWFPSLRNSPVGRLQMLPTCILSKNDKSNRPQVVQNVRAHTIKELSPVRSIYSYLEPRYPGQSGGTHGIKFTCSCWTNLEANTWKMIRFRLGRASVPSDFGKTRYKKLELFEWWDFFLNVSGKKCVTSTRQWKNTFGREKNILGVWLYHRQLQHWRASGTKYCSHRAII